MKNPILLVILIITSLCLSSNAQIQIQSKIVDNKTGEAIPFANISIENTTKGTMSNQEGKFQLHINLVGINTKVIVSSLGYQTLRIHPKKIGKTIQLNPVSYGIDEVKVSANKLLSDPKKILKECMKAAPSFRPNQPYINKGFLRQTSLLDKKYMKLIEAALFTYATPEEPKIKVHILEKRNTFDNREIDAKNLYFFKQWKKMNHKKAKQTSKNYQPSKEELQQLVRDTDEERNSISNLRRLKTAHQPKIGDMWYHLKNIYKCRIHQIKLDTILDLDGEQMYKLKVLPTKKQLKDGVYLVLGYLLISTKDFALHELKIGHLINSIYTSKKNTAISYCKILKYKKHNGKLYPYYYKSFGSDFAGYSSYEIEKKRKKKPKLIKELLFTEIITQKDQINQLLPTQWNDKLYEPTKYHPEFWENYTILLETKDEAKLRKDLEAEVSIKEQYQHATDSIRINQIN